MVDTSDKFVVATEGPGRKVHHLNGVEELKKYNFSKWSVKEVPRTYPKTPRETEKALSEGGVSELAKSMEGDGVTKMTANPDNLSDAWDLPEEDNSEDDDAPKDWNSAKEQIAEKHGEESFNSLWRKAVENERDTPSEAERIKEQARLRDNSGWQDVVEDLEEPEETESSATEQLSEEELKKREEAARAFEDRGGVWTELAEEIAEESEESVTTYQVGKHTTRKEYPDGSVWLQTTNEDVKRELRELKEKDELSAKILSVDGDELTAKLANPFEELGA